MQEKLKRDINSGILVETIREEKLEHEAISLEMLREKDASGRSQRYEMKTRQMLRNIFLVPFLRIWVNGNSSLNFPVI